MSISATGGAMYGGDAVARMSEAYGATAIDITEPSSAQDEPTRGSAEQARGEDAASQPVAVAVAPEAAVEAPAGTGDVVESEKDEKPFRVFASETEYREHLAEETRRQRSAQAASDLELKNQRMEVERLKQEIQAHERTRNELYARASKEQIEPETIVEVFTRREGETKAEFAERQREAEAIAATEAAKGNAESLLAQATTEATKGLLLERALTLTQELGVIKGLDVKTALEKAITGSPEAQRLAKLSYTGPDEETRRWAQGEAYAIGERIVRDQAGKLAAATVKVVDPIEPAVSIQAPASLGREVPRYRDSVEALSAAYGGSR